MRESIIDIADNIVTILGNYDEIENIADILSKAYVVPNDSIFDSLLSKLDAVTPSLKREVTLVQTECILASLDNGREDQYSCKEPTGAF